MEPWSQVLREKTDATYKTLCDQFVLILQGPEEAPGVYKWNLKTTKYRQAIDAEGAVVRKFLDTVPGCLNAFEFSAYSGDLYKGFVIFNISPVPVIESGAACQCEMEIAE